MALRVWRALDRAADSALLERLIRGRAWIGVLAFALIGIVAMQLFVLKLNNEIGRTLQRQITLERQNAQLGIEGSEASAGNLVEPEAAAAGMTFAAPGTLHFLTSGTAQLGRAVAALSAPIQPTSSASEAENSVSASTANGTSEAASSPSASTATGASQTEGSAGALATSGASEAESSAAASTTSTGG